MKKIVLLISILFLFIYCGPKQAEVDKIIEDGVEVVLNHLEPYEVRGEPSKLILEEKLRIDTENDEIAETGLTDIAEFNIDSEGNIYFLNSQNPENYCFKFDNEGEFVIAFGKRGQGPSEHMSAQGLRENEQGQIEIFDNTNEMQKGNRRLFFYEKSGKFIKEIKLPQEVLRATLLRNGNVLAIKSHFNMELGREIRPIVLYNEDYEEIKILHPGLSLGHLQLAKTLNPLESYSDFNTFRVSEYLIYVGNYGGDEYEFLVYDTVGKLIRKIRKEYAKVEVPNHIEEETISFAKKSGYPKDIIDKVEYPKFYSPFQFFFLDEKGRLYVRTHERGKNPSSFIYDIFNPDGYFIARIELDNYGRSPYSYIPELLLLPLSVISKNNHIYCLREKESRYKELVVYRTRWE